MSLRAVLALISVEVLAQLVVGEARGAETARRVALFPIEDDAALYARLAAELRSQGFEPIEVSLPAEGNGPGSPPLDPFLPLSESILVIVPSPVFATQT